MLLHSCGGQCFAAAAASAKLCYSSMKSLPDSVAMSCQTLPAMAGTHLRHDVGHDGTIAVSVAEVYFSNVLYQHGHAVAVLHHDVAHIFERLHLCVAADEIALHILLGVSAT